MEPPRDKMNELGNLMTKAKPWTELEEKKVVALTDSLASTSINQIPRTYSAINVERPNLDPLA